MTNPTIETDIASILKKINDNQEKLLEKVDTIDKRLVVVETKLDNSTENIKELKETQKTLVKDVSDLKGAKSLIIPIIVAVTTSLITLLIRAIPAP
jgi:chromosome segregation ATPase